MESANEPPPDEPSETATPVLLLMCPTCDEPFTPEYAGRCPSCGHDFGEGYEVYSETSPVQQVTSRVAIVVLGLVVLMLGAVAFFVMVLR